MSVTETFPLPPSPLIPCVTFFPRVLRVGTPRPSYKNYPSSSNVLVLVFVAQYSLTCTSLRPAVSFLSVGVASFRLCPPYCVRRPVAPWPYSLVPPYRPSRFLIGVASCRSCPPYRVLWPRGLTTLSLRTDRLVFVRRCGFVSLLPALSRPSSCGPLALLNCSSVPAVSFLIVGVASCRSCPPYRVRRPVAPWPYYLVPPYRRLVFVRRCGFVSLLPTLSRPSSCGPVALLICPSVPPVFPLSSSRVLP